MVAIDYGNFIQEFWMAISGKLKTMELLQKYINDPELIGHIMAFEAPFPPYKLVADDCICEDYKISARSRFMCIHQGCLMGIPATGKSVENREVMFIISR